MEYKKVLGVDSPKANPRPKHILKNDISLIIPWHPLWPHCNGLMLNQLAAGQQNALPTRVASGEQLKRAGLDDCRPMESQASQAHQHREKEDEVGVPWPKMPLSSKEATTSSYAFVFSSCPTTSLPKRSWVVKA